LNLCCWAAAGSGLGGESVKDATAGCRFSAPGSTEVFILDLASPRLLLYPSSPSLPSPTQPPPPRSASLSLAGNSQLLSSLFIPNRN